MRLQVEARLSGLGGEVLALAQDCFEVVESLLNCLPICRQRLGQCRPDAHLEDLHFLVAVSPGRCLRIEQRRQRVAQRLDFGVCDGRRLAKRLILKAPAGFDVACLALLASGSGDTQRLFRFGYGGWPLRNYEQL
ncbi:MULTISPECIES: hypothetical protein [unclassified Mesorhizobium]|nr:MULTISPECIES: hypothetical protein [unclassified Mesorhizobium]RUV88186.1 hypothetical protein EOA51_08205 [Mesorhizobium sp. M1A.F.Ca.IN.020.32.1.1]RWG90980.1 MAG: hypothetical protein EOQ68_06830 [Mesorhizobium sp.]RWH08671.1 MAG: hypothetical protein EOQ71_10685 [Mesorhizobium sp.]TIN63857.1 MAG: hypothetical protein E5Y26_12950 [Mesorhizobium sp.]